MTNLDAVLERRIDNARWQMILAWQHGDLDKARQWDREMKRLIGRREPQGKVVGE